VANIKNLRPSEYKLSQEEAKKGGIRSGEVRREKATMKKTLEMLLNETNKKSGKTYKELSTLGLIKGAVNGKAENYRLIIELMGELQEQQNNTPEVNINIIDNSDLEKVMYEKK
jgi:hypothetical protein